MGKLSPTMAMMQRKIQIDGPMTKIMKYVGATNRLIDVLKSVPAEWA